VVEVDYIFAIDIEHVGRFPVGRIVDDVDRRGNKIQGRVVEVKPGNKIALVIVDKPTKRDP